MRAECGAPKRLGERYRAHVVSILILDPTRGLDNPASVVDQGSGILLRSPSRRFILTAKHVVDGYRGRNMVAALGATNGQPREVAASMRSMSYIAVYRALVKPPPQRLVVLSGADYALSLDPGPLTLRYQSAVRDPNASGTFDLKYEVREFEPGSYVIVQVIPTATVDVPGAAWSVAHDRFARAVVALDLEFPGIVQDKLFEAAVATPAMPLFIAPEEGLELGGPEGYGHREVADRMRMRADEAPTLPESDVARFTLASRWFRRANDSKNVIDRILFYYMVLEVYPTVKGNDVPGDVSRFLAERVYSSLSASEVKTRLKLGPICSFRGLIVHEGKASVESFDEWQKVIDYAQRLRATARTCLRVLAGLNPGSELDEYILPQQPAGGRPRRTAR